MLQITGRAHSTLINRVHHVDLFTLCDWIAEAGVKVDMILADLPYGTTACAWDTVIPFEPMWARFKRVIKPRGAIVLTASQPFTSALVMSNVGMFRYEWVWNKIHAGNFANAINQPLKVHESILVFSDETADYFPQKWKSKPYTLRVNNKARQTYGDMSFKILEYADINERYPVSIIELSNRSEGSGNRLHPTQKPVDLFRYLIRTYTRPGDLVLDPVVGSGTTAIAAREEQRRFIVGDSSAEYVQVARDRLAAPYTLPLFGAA